MSKPMRKKGPGTGSKYPECRHIMPSGLRCQSPALLNHPFCYFHSRQRSLKEANMYRMKSVALPPLEDRAAIQLGINEILAGLASRKIDRREASTYLYGIQMAINNLAYAPQLPADDPVLSVLPAAYGDELAPQADPGNDPPKDDPPQVVYGEDYSHTPLIRTCLPEIDESATHEYDHEPQIEPRKLTPEEKVARDILANHMITATSYRDADFNPASDGAGGTP